jgi:serine/tyrosine/threonine adenylyltransferase
LEWKELEQLVWHACYREFRDEAYTPFVDKNDIASAATVMLERSAERLAQMTSEWIRVGFCQGNFNADNCLVGGHTMDYGPFGFMEEYNPLFAKWTGYVN